MTSSSFGVSSKKVCNWSATKSLSPPVVRTSSSHAVRSKLGGPAKGSSTSVPRRSPAEGGHKFLHMDRTADVVVHARLQAQLAVALHGVGRHGDNARPLGSRPADDDPARGL